MENLYIDKSIVFKDDNIVIFLAKFAGLKERHDDDMTEFCKLLYNLRSAFCCMNDEKNCSSQLAWALQTDSNGNTYNYYEFCEKVLHLEKSYVKRLCRVYTKFLEGRGALAHPLELEEFSVSKLIELLPLSVDEILELIKNKQLFPSMTRKQIRELVKSIKGKASEDEESEEDIPLAFDPKQVYEFQYFDGLSKSQLVNIAMSYQNYIHKGKNG